MYSDRREHKRVPLSMDFCMLSHPSGLTFLGILRNISISGMMVGLDLDDEEVDVISEGDRLMVEEFPVPMQRFMCSREAKVVWLHGDQCGLRFLENLDVAEDVMESFREEGDLPPWEGMSEDLKQLFRDPDQENT